MNEIARQSQAEFFMCIIEDMHMNAFSELYAQGKISPQVKADYLIFCETARELFSKVGEKFSIDMVHVRLPENEWVKLYHEYKSTKP